nr:MAG TPA: SITE SPECIFIC RECOMBINASE XERD [Caudoviricetes sp.]
MVGSFGLGIIVTLPICIAIPPKAEFSTTLETGIIIGKKEDLPMEPRMELINSVLAAMTALLAAEQLDKLQEVLCIKLHDFEVQPRSTEVMITDNSAEGMLNRFIATKRLEGTAETTIRLYSPYIMGLIRALGKPLYKVDTYDIRYYLSLYKQQRQVANRTLENMRKCFSSFFGWLSDEGLIGRNPCKAIKAIKYEKTVKKPFSPEERERLKNACTNLRDLALIEFLYASGCRVSEVVRLNISDIKFHSRDVVVLGKGGKERRIYLTEVATMHLANYLAHRRDDSPALFVSRHAPHGRMGKTGIEAVLRKLGENTGIEKVHPHRYRRTLATNLVDRGAPIQDVQQILGHADIRTTQIYLYNNPQNIRYSYEKYSA